MSWARVRDERRGPHGGRAIQVLSVAVLVVSLVLLLTTVSTERARLLEVDKDRPPAASVRAPGYVDLRALRRGPNAEVYKGAFEKLLGPLPDAGQPNVPSDEGKRLRAYQGAPPVIPHPVSPASVSDCLACHELGGQLAGRAAPPMRHPRREVCTQCHVANVAKDREQAGAPAPAPLASNRFQGAFGFGFHDGGAP